ncbi:hypothetical protein ACO0LC_27405 [Undibacterium sp. JH2W]|uniref:hypothetical protein n=1 Tax=Undibacterium sp. JH2W TaxID=3413037 RepID=UPI003BF3165D
MGLELVYVGFFFLFLWAVAYLASGLGFFYAYKRRRTNLRKAFIVGFLSFCVFVPTSIFLIKRIWPAHINVTLDESTTIDTIMSQEKTHCVKLHGLDNDYHCHGIVYYLTVHLPDKTVFRVKAKNISLTTYPDSRKLKSMNVDIKQSYSKEELTAYLKRKEEQKSGDFTESVIPQNISDEILAWLLPSTHSDNRHTKCDSNPDYWLCLEAVEGSSGDYTLQFWTSKD